MYHYLKGLWLAGYSIGDDNIKQGGEVFKDWQTVFI